MNFGARLKAEPVRELAFGAFAASGTNFVLLKSAANPGGLIQFYTKILTFCNTMNVDMYISLDGINNHFRIASESGRTIDLRNNDIYQIPGDAMYARYFGSGAPASGAIWAEVLYV